jgi:hypothetical protein
MSTIYDFVKQQRDNYRSQTVEITGGYEFSQYQPIRTIELYHNSKFTTGTKDSLGREKPFYNITKFRVNVATRATDLDTKNVKVFSCNPGEYVAPLFLRRNALRLLRPTVLASMRRFSGCWLRAEPRDLGAVHRAQ